MSPRPDVSEERKNQIIQAAMKVFSRQGFNEARMDDIVTESGLSKGALYWYFKSKDEIIIAILDRMFERELRSLRRLLEDERPAPERLLEFTQEAVQDLGRFLQLMPLAYEFYSLAFRMRPVRVSPSPV